MCHYDPAHRVSKVIAAGTNNFTVLTQSYVLDKQISTAVSSVHLSSSGELEIKDFYAVSNHLVAQTKNEILLLSISDLTIEKRIRLGEIGKSLRIDDRHVAIAVQ